VGAGDLIPLLFPHVMRGKIHISWGAQPVLLA
jgi:hypothetical protein